jgi:hypothetical protein
MFARPTLPAGPSAKFAQELGELRAKRAHADAMQAARDFQEAPTLHTLAALAHHSCAASQTMKALDVRSLMKPPMAKRMLQLVQSAQRAGLWPKLV